MTTGYEPMLMRQERGRAWRLSPRRLATMLTNLPPEAISLAAAEEMLQHENFNLRYHAATLLSQRGDREARLIMEKALVHPSAPVRASVARHLDGFSWFVAEPMLRQALQDADARVREGAVYALCSFGSPAAMQLLMQVLVGENDDVLQAAAIGLRKHTTPDAVPVLNLVLQAVDPLVRGRSLESLGANQTSDAAAAVRRMLLTDPDPDVQYEAMQSLVELLEATVLAEIPDILHNSSGLYRHARLRGLLHACNYVGVNIETSPYCTQILEALADCSHDESEMVRLQTTYLLAWIKHPRATELLEQAVAAEVDEVLKAQMTSIGVSLGAIAVG
ncbi:MAG: HEAT repeat domain-containing protein [Chloroflexi bacterium]|nr:HEAT repeat domain-containing protein [Chloroflexota bacterium]